MAIFLLKTEPSDYSFDDLRRDGTTTWTGVTNAAALINLRSMRKGDEAFIYHTGDEKSIVGLAKVTRDAFQDPQKPGTTPEGKPKFAVVELKAMRAAKSPVSLAQLKGDERFKAFLLVTHSRLSVMPVSVEQDAMIRELAGL